MRSERHALQIIRQNLLLTEGADSDYFWRWTLERWKIETVQVMNFGGVGELDKYLASLLGMEDFATVQNLIVVRDAETDANSALGSVKTSLSKRNIPVPERCFQWAEGEPKTAILLYPGLDASGELKSGTLEDLCLEILADSSVTNCVESHLRCLEEISAAMPRPHKTRLHTYLSSIDNYVGMKIGEATKAQAFDLDHPALQPFRNLLTPLG